MRCAERTLSCGSGRAGERELIQAELENAGSSMDKVQKGSLKVTFGGKAAIDASYDPLIVLVASLVIYAVHVPILVAFTVEHPEDQSVQSVLLPRLQPLLEDKEVENVDINGSSFAPVTVPLTEGGA